MVAQLNEAQTEAVRSMGFGSFLKSASFVLPNWQRFTVATFDACVTLGVPIGGREIIESKYDEVHAAWVKAWKIEHTAPELTCMPEFILANKDVCESFRRNFIIYLQAEELLLQQVHPQIRQGCESECIPRLVQVCSAEAHQQCEALQGEQEELPLKSAMVASEKRAYQKAFITRMSMHSFTSPVAQLNKTQVDTVKSMGFAPFLKVDVK
ncbi:hypothetical protein Cgig2_002597 [Carnegiea gigantea]|uniref:Uncharacterized protein n=1 Tax=Carnegiea gigantea TaxID=171969 RepID=A0A9Q1JKM0_9CARY|nr:hypothetical protein Cgig2_002597 [Carnegiea gigantea]